MFDIINNTSKLLGDDLKKELKDGSSVRIAASCFSIYAYAALKEELEKIDELKFLFTTPTFVESQISDNVKKEKREFYIPKGLCGTDFEIRLKNQMTQRAIARECAEWMRNKVRLKTLKEPIATQSMINVERTDNCVHYTPVNGFTTTDLGYEQSKSNLVGIMKSDDAAQSKFFINEFDNLWNNSDSLKDVTDYVVDYISSCYKENAPEFIYFIILYNIFKEFLQDLDEDHMPNEATGFKNSLIWNKLYNFQKDGVIGIINKLERYNGCILADSVGLGKTFTALAVMQYYSLRNKAILVLCPKRLEQNWTQYQGNKTTNIFYKDRIRFDVLFHTDLGRTSGKSGGMDLATINWGNYDLVVIDESHNFRNNNAVHKDKDTRYDFLMKRIMQEGVKTKVLMLSATPVNNRYNDLKNQLALAYEGHTDYIDEKLNTNRTIDEIFRNAQRAFNTWSKWEPSDRTTENLLKMLDFDFFEVLDSVTIARSRKHIQKYYDTTDIGTFPIRLKPLSPRPHLTDLKTAINYNEIFEQLMLLTLTIYTPTHYILPSKMDKYAELYEDNKVNVGFTQANREQGIRRLTAINLMKRMESSVYSFNLTLKRIKNLIESTIATIDRFNKQSAHEIELTDISNMDEFDDEDQNTDDLFSFGRKIKIDLADMDYVSWKDSLVKDAEVLELLTVMVGDITPEHDSKLQELYKIIDKKISNPINEGNKKIIIFGTIHIQTER